MPGDAQDRTRHEGGGPVSAAAADLLAARLGAAAPQPPRGARARLDGRSVVVSWQPGPGPVGTVAYRVTRWTGRDGSAREVRVGEVPGNEITDTGVPVGTEASYTVVAVHGGREVSEAVSTGPVVVTPEVDSLRVSAGERSVSGSWQAPVESVRVEVLRGEGAPPRGAGDGVRVETDGTGFHDTDVRADVDYHYRVRAVYLTSSGHARGSAGLVRRTSPGPPPAPVRDLSVLPDDDTGFVASWTQPPRGRVVLRSGVEPPNWPTGALVGPGDLDSYGREVPQSSVEGREGGDGRALAALTLEAGTNHVLAATVTGGQAAVGVCVRVTAVSPVEGLRAERFDTSVRLGWTWPDDAAAAVVSWLPGDPGAPPGAGGELRCTRRQYESDGGFEALMGTESVRVDVRAVVPCADGESVSPPVGVTVPGRAVLGYRVEAAGLLRRDRVVHLVAEDACAMPAVAVVYAKGPVQPHSSAQGLVLATFPAQCLSAGDRVSVRVRPPRGEGSGWLMCFPVDESDRGVRLRQPPVKELRW